MTERRNSARSYPDLFSDAGMSHDEAWPFACGEGWRPIVERLLWHLRRVAARSGPVQVRDIRARHGRLEVILSRMDEGLFLLLLEAAVESTKTCEICGDPGRREEHPHA